MVPSDWVFGLENSELINLFGNIKNKWTYGKQWTSHDSFLVTGISDVPISAQEIPFAEMRQSYDHPTWTMVPQAGKTTASLWIGAPDLMTHRIIYDVAWDPIKATGRCHGTPK